MRGTGIFGTTPPAIGPFPPVPLEDDPEEEPDEPAWPKRAKVEKPVVVQEMVLEDDRTARECRPGGTIVAINDQR